MKRLCMQWPRFGPYHLARLEATHAVLQERGVELVGLETAGRDATYAWDVDEAEPSFRRERIFAGRVFDDLSPAEIHAGVIAALDRLQPDAVTINSYSFPDARACLWWCRRHRRTAVVITDSKEDDAPRSFWRERLKSIVVNQFDAALLGGTPHRSYFEKLGFPAEYIYLGCDVVDNDYFWRRAQAVRSHPERVRHLPGLEDDAPYFVAVNRFLPLKNLEGLLTAYARYRDGTASPWRLVLVGDGPGRERIEAQIRDASIPGVVLPGFRRTEEVAAYYGRAGAFVHPTFKDTWGLVVNEAMAAGLPVLVSERAGCAHDLVVEGENGHRFAPEDTDRLAELLTCLAASADRERMGRRSRELVAAWSLERFAESTWQAVEAGRRRADRSFDPAARGILWGLRMAARDVHSFHAVEA